MEITICNENHQVLELPCPNCQMKADISVGRFVLAINRQDKFTCQECGHVFVVEVESMTEKERADRLEGMVDRMSETISECVLLIWPLYDLTQQIEICGASIELTKAVTMSSEIMHKLMQATGQKQLPKKEMVCDECAGTGKGGSTIRDLQPPESIIQAMATAATQVLIAFERGYRMGD